MKNNIKFTKVPKEKEQERLYHTPKLENVKIDNNSIFIKELDKLVNGEINEIDLNKIKNERKKKC